MADCNCAKDWRAIPKNKRMFVEEPGAVFQRGGQLVRDASKVIVFDKDCPKHGYKEIANDRRPRPV